VRVNGVNGYLMSYRLDYVQFMRFDVFSSSNLATRTRTFFMHKTDIAPPRASVLD